MDDTISKSGSAYGSTIHGASSLASIESNPGLAAVRAESAGQTYVPPNAVHQGSALLLEPQHGTEKASEPFAAIDAGSGTPVSHWTVAGNHRAEAGFQDPELGWVSVRAQAGSGGMHVTLVPTSDAAAQVLDTHLAGLNAHVRPHYEHLNPVTLASPEPGSNSLSTGEHAAQRDGRDKSQNQGQQDSSATPIETPHAPSRPHEVKVRALATPAIITGQNSHQHHVSVIV
jgi:hypothetical protein